MFDLKKKKKKGTMHVYRDFLPNVLSVYIFMSAEFSFKSPVRSKMCFAFWNLMNDVGAEFDTRRLEGEDLFVSLLT